MFVCCVLPRMPTTHPNPAPAKLRHLRHLHRSVVSWHSTKAGVLVLRYRRQEGQKTTPWGRRDPVGPRTLVAPSRSTPRAVCTCAPRPRCPARWQAGPTVLPGQPTLPPPPAPSHRTQHNPPHRAHTRHHHDCQSWRGPSQGHTALLARHRRSRRPCSSCCCWPEQGSCTQTWPWGTARWRCWWRWWT